MLEPISNPKAPEATSWSLPQESDKEPTRKGPQIIGPNV